MKKELVKEALKVITYLQDQYIGGKTFNGHDTFTIYIPADYIMTLSDLLIAYQAQSVTIKSLKEQIKELENMKVELVKTKKKELENE